MWYTSKMSLKLMHVGTSLNYTVPVTGHTIRLPPSDQCVGCCAHHIKHTLVGKSQCHQ